MASVSSYQKLFWTCSCSFEFVRTRTIAKGIAKSQLYRSVLYIWCCCVGLFFPVCGLLYYYDECSVRLMDEGKSNNCWLFLLKHLCNLEGNAVTVAHIMQWNIFLVIDLQGHWLFFFLELLLFKAILKILPNVTLRCICHKPFYADRTCLSLFCESIGWAVCLRWGFKM